MQITEITGTELSELLRTLRRELREKDDAIHTLRVAVDRSGFKFKVNEGMWTPGYGTTTGDTVPHPRVWPNYIDD